MPSNDITLYAKWELADITITFDSLGGTPVEPITQKYNSIVEEPTAPIKDGYTFAGWYTDRSFNESYSFYRMPSKNITLYAKYDVNTYTVYFETFGGTTISDIKVKEGYNFLIPDTPKKEGYTFNGWYLDNNYNNQYNFSNLVYNDITLYAYWT